MHEMMKEEGVMMNSICFNALIDSCARVGAMDKAAQLLEDMTNLNIDLDLIAYFTIIQGYSVAILAQGGQRHLPAGSRWDRRL